MLLSSAWFQCISKKNKLLLTCHLELMLVAQKKFSYFFLSCSVNCPSHSVVSSDPQFKFTCLWKVRLLLCEKPIRPFFLYYPLEIQWSWAVTAIEIQAHSLLVIIEELFSQLSLTMDAIIEKKLNSHLIKNALPQIFDIKQWYQNPVTQIRNISVLQKLHLKINLETTQEISDTRSILTTPRYLCRNRKMKKLCLP